MSGGAWNVTVGYYLNPKMEVEFLYARQFSMPAVSRPAAPLKLANRSVDNYHGTFVYNFGSAATVIRPFVFGGIGITSYIPDDIDPSVAAQARRAGLRRSSTSRRPGAA